MNEREYAEHRITVARVNISSLRRQIGEYEREIATHEKTLRGESDPGYEWCPVCEGTGSAGERDTCVVCDGSGMIKED